jgi:hypothetical protein
MVIEAENFLNAHLQPGELRKPVVVQRTQSPICSPSLRPKSPRPTRKLQVQVFVQRWKYLESDLHRQQQQEKEAREGVPSLPFPFHVAPNLLDSVPTFGVFPPQFLKTFLHTQKWASPVS